MEIVFRKHQEPNVLECPQNLRFSMYKKSKINKVNR